jgi:hypothetical protein
MQTNTPPWTPDAEALRDRVVERLRELLDEQVPKFAADTEAREIEPCDVEIVLANLLGDGRWHLLRN